MSRNIEQEIKSLKDGFVHIQQQTGVYFLNQELNNEIVGITSGLDSIKLDQLFLTNSTTHRTQVDPRFQTQNYAAILDLIRQGELLLIDLKANLNKNSLCSLQDNQIRKTLFVCKEKMRAFIRKINPYSNEAYIRLNNYSVEIGLIDRFSTIKNEILNREPRNTLQAWTDWTDRKYPEPAKFKTPDWRDYTYGLRHDDDNAKRYRNKVSSTNKKEAGFYFPDSTNFYSSDNHNTNNLNNDYEIINLAENYDQHRRNNTSPHDKYPSKDVEDLLWRKNAEGAGITTKFPGITEYQSRFSKPIRQTVKNLSVNPQPDPKLINRPFVSAEVDSLTTEYRDRYLYPDSNKIDKFPWIKQY